MHQLNSVARLVHNFPPPASFCGKTLSRFLSKLKQQPPKDYCHQRAHFVFISNLDERQALLLLSWLRNGSLLGTLAGRILLVWSGTQHGWEDRQGICGPKGKRTSVTGFEYLPNEDGSVSKDRLHHSFCSLIATIFICCYSWCPNLLILLLLWTLRQICVFFKIYTFPSLIRFPI